MSSIKPLLSCEVPLDKLKLPVFVSTKLDGIRCLVIDSVVYSRSLKPIRNKYVQKLFGKPEYNDMDGELVVGDVYAKDVFQKTTSGVMSAEGEPDVKFYVFDICNRPEETFTARRFILHNKLKDTDNRVVMLDQHYMIYNSTLKMNVLRVVKVLSVVTLMGSTNMDVLHLKSNYL